jgi:hypothetical protein
MPFPLADAPQTRLGAFSGPDDTLRVMVELALGPRGEQSTMVRSMKDNIVRHLTPKDYLSEILAVRNFAHEKIRYSNDALGVEQVQDPQRICEQINAHGNAVGDCFPEGTLLLRDDYELVPIEEIRVGDRIWGLNDWSTVEAKVFKGELPVSVVRMNNGSDLKLTQDHKVYVRRGDEETRIPVRDLRKGMELAAPDRIAAGVGSISREQAYLDGLYIADGWCEEHRFFISGLDGHPKEAQKHEIQESMRRLGVSTRWHRKYLAINDRGLAQRMSQMGSYAPDKRFLSLDMDVDCVSESLRGVLADSGKNTNGSGRTFTTTSRELCLQTRVLLRMLGISAGYRYVENHGGLGKNPIYRLGIRGKAKKLRVKQLDLDVFKAPCWDIQTSDHRVYLPEHDVTVSNCDDIATFIGALCRQLGRECEFVVVGFGRPGFYSHVFARVKEPKSGKWIVCDPVAGTEEARMLQRVTTWKSVKVDL